MNNLKRITLYIMNIADIFSLVLAFAVSYVIKFKIISNGNSQSAMEIYSMLLMCILVAYLIINIFFLYNDDFMGRSLRKELLASLKMVLYVTVLVVLFLFFSKVSTQYSRIQMVAFIISAFVIDFVCRVIVKKFIFPKYKKGNVSEKIVIVAPLAHIEAAIKKLDNSLNWRSRVVGLVVTDYDKKGCEIHGIQVISNLDRMYLDIANAEVDSIFIIAGDQYEMVNEWTEKLQEIGKVVYIKINEYYLNESNRFLDKIGDYAVVSYLPVIPMRNRQIAVKRGMDLVITLLLFPFYIFIFLLAAFFTQIESPGRVLFARIRIGKNGRRFYQYRFRLLRMDANGRIQRGKTPYTKIGKILEFTHLDGLPMLINVLYGDMSLIGPKAPKVEEFIEYTAEQRRNLCVTTGVAGCWSCENDQAEVIKAEREYIEKWNLLQDCKIILEMVVRYITFHSKRKYTEETVREELEQIAEYESFKQPLQYNRNDYIRKCTVVDYIYLFLKRAIDIIGAAVGIIVLSPIFLILAILVIADDGGNPFYGHTRVGKNGKKITIYKFRSMRKDAGDLEKLLTPEQLEQYRREFKVDNDPRITRVGNFIRKTSLDELPQLINILKGDISIVGPRPIVEKETAIYGDDIAKLLSVKPGLTGYWQAYARNNATYASGERQKMEMYYVEHMSLWLDIKILFKTVQSVFKQEGAQ